MAGARPVVQKFCSEVWWLVLLRGIASVVLGGLLIAKPALSAMVVVQFLGAFFLIDGVFSVISSIMGRKYMPGWGWGLVMGALEIMAGIMVFGHPLAASVVTVTTLVYCVAFIAILSGILGVVTWLQVRKEVEGEWAMIVGGLLSIIFGVFLIANPLASAAIYLTIMGVMAVVGGIVHIFTSLRIRKIGAAQG